MVRAPLVTEQRRVSVVIRCRNEEEHIGRLLAGILEQSIEGVDIVVVDSGSTDATLSIVDRFPVRLLRIRPHEFSFGRALNRGFEAARGEFVVAASAHVYPVYRDWLARLLQPFDDPQVALVYGKQRGDERTRYSERRVFATWFPETSDLNQPHPFCNNANAAVRRSIWKGLPYDETLTGLEDLDWANASNGGRLSHRLRCRRGGDPCASGKARAPSSIGIGAKPLQWRGSNRRYASDSSTSFALRLPASSATSVMAGGMRTRSAIRDIAVFRVMQFWGTYRGFRESGSVTIELDAAFLLSSGLASRRGWRRAGAGRGQRSHRLRPREREEGNRWLSAGPPG